MIAQERQVIQFDRSNIQKAVGFSDYTKNTNRENLVKDVAIYLRKSRGEEVDLEKHRTLLTELCLMRNWKYTEYFEIGVSDSIDLRPKMIELLHDIEEDLFDAVVVVDLDRLSRGDDEETSRIKRTLRQHDTLIITPQRTYDLENESDDLTASFENIMGRFEYKQIKKRFRRGKKIGARRGDWVNGIPPYPYEYQQWYDEEKGKLYQNSKGLVVNRKKYDIYRYIVESYINERMPPDNIAWELNKRCIPAPRGSRWHGVTVSRILLDETHLGWVVTNKSEGDAHRVKRSKESKPYRRIEKKDWVTTKNCHEAVKSEEEHRLILLNMNERSGNRSNRKGVIIRPLTGLVVCAKCNHTLQSEHKKYADGSDVEYIKHCWYRDEYGNLCDNMGSKADIIHEEIFKQLDLYEEELYKSLEDNTDGNNVLQEMEQVFNSIEQLEKKIIKINELVEADYYTPLEAKARKEEVKQKIDEQERQLNILKIKYDSAEKMTNSERIAYIKKFREALKNNELSWEEQNRWYKSIIANILWEKLDSDTLRIKINFL